MPYPALAIANYFIDKGVFENDPVDHLRLQKLVYLAHGWSLAARDEPLLEEPVEAWRYGPVIRSLFHVFKGWGNRPIDENGILFYRDGRASVPSVKPGDGSTKELLEQVWTIYKDYPGVQLSDMTHEPGTPWTRTWESSAGEGSAPIDDEVIRQHFLGLSREPRAAL